MKDMLAGAVSGQHIGFAIEVLGTATAEWQKVSGTLASVHHPRYDPDDFSESAVFEIDVLGSAVTIKVDRKHTVSVDEASDAPRW